MTYSIDSFCTDKKLFLLSMYIHITIFFQIYSN